MAIATTVLNDIRFVGSFAEALGMLPGLTDCDVNGETFVSTLYVVLVRTISFSDVARVFASPCLATDELVPLIGISTGPLGSCALLDGSISHPFGDAPTAGAFPTGGGGGRSVGGPSSSSGA